MPSATQAFISTYKEVLDSKKWVGSYLQVAIAICLVQFLGWSLTDAMIVSAPIALAVASQAHVDAAEAKAQGAAPVVDASTTNVKNVNVEDVK